MPPEFRLLLGAAILGCCLAYALWHWVLVEQETLSHG